MNRRITVNLAAFTLLAVVLSVWALKSVLRLDAFAQPYRISAEFASSPGLQPNFDVTYLGVAVGKVRSVRSADRMVVAELEIDKGRRIPSGVTAAAGLKSAIGEPYVDLEPGPGQAEAAPMKPGETIPLARTSVSQTYGDLFSVVNRAVSGLNPDDLRTVTRELAAGLDGRADSLGNGISAVSRLAGAFADDTQVIDGLITNLGGLTKVLADHRNSLADGLSGTAALTSALADTKGDLVRLLEDSPDVLARLTKLLDDSKAAMKCTLSALGTGLPTLLTRENVADLSTGLQWAPQLVAALNGVTTYVNGDPNLNLKFIITTGPVKAATEYRELLSLPVIPRIPTCPGIALPAVQQPSPDRPANATPPVTATPRPGGGDSPGGPDSVAVRNSANKTDGGPGWYLWLPPVLAGLVLLRVALNALNLAGRARRRRR
ncbi:MCE family protein [Actinocorallia sp. A-T 12471]|uniref:MCE family protein n=1 Tax=Actinocorallia sp. A-T 12471 TaxID=3089813 RepID=UPI0029D36C15|nr:MCE family protein [Actinocorallia sp. A-T 12471]MDX6741481.1 MCE family protein [Actinocorallia sp. A-T 12471]